MKKLQIIETRNYLNQLSKILHKGQDETELRNGIKNFIGENPQIGTLIPGTGGLRKIRYPMPGKGKSGGYRVIYYLYDETKPINLLTIYSKNRREDLSSEETKIFSKLIKELKEIYRGER